MKSVNSVGRCAALAVGVALWSSPAGADMSDVLVEKYAALCENVMLGAVTNNPDLGLDVSSEVYANLRSPEMRAELESLAKLGRITKFQLSGITHLAQGDAFNCQFQHEKGISVWMLGYSPFSHTVEGAAFGSEMFVPVTAPQTPPPTNSQPAPQPGSSVPSEPPASPEMAEACQAFPDLC